MAETREEDLSEFSGDDALERIRSLKDEGWRPTAVTLTRDDSKDDENVVLRDEPTF